jgi:hypothetical protein
MMVLFGACIGQVGWKNAQLNVQMATREAVEQQLK